MKKRTFATALSGLLAGVFLLSGCRESTGTEKETGETADPAAEKYAAMAEADLKNAILLADTAVSAYADDSGVRVFLAETYDMEKAKAEGTASVWHFTSFYAMTSRLAALAEGETREKYALLNGKTYAGFGNYLGTTQAVTYGGVKDLTAYGVHRSAIAGKNNIDGDLMVYDDQMWIVRELLYSYRTTGNRDYLNEAVRLADVCLSGWDSSIDENGTEYGGIPWGPSYATKHTCSNAPLIAPLIEIYEIRKAQSRKDAEGYLDAAKKLYDFTVSKLENRTGVFGDLIGTERVQEGEGGERRYVTVSEGGRDETAYSYNTGAMLSAAAALYRATGEEKYLTDGKRFSDGAVSQFCGTNRGVKFFWTVNRKGTPSLDTQTVWFNLVLLQGFLDLSPYYEGAEKAVGTFETSLNYAVEHYLRDGFLPRDFVTGWNGESPYDQKKNVMDQAACAEMYAMIAEWARERAGLPAPKNEEIKIDLTRDPGKPNEQEYGKEYRLEKIAAAVNDKNEDSAYLIRNDAQANASERYADGRGSLVYRFTIDSMVEPEITLSLRQDYKVSVSWNGDDYVTAVSFRDLVAAEPEKYPASAFAESGGYTAGTNRTEYVIRPYEYGIYTELYVLIEDATPQDGWGGTIDGIRIEYYVEK